MLLPFLTLLSTAAAISSITVDGNAFFTDDGSRFYIRGVAYQPGGSSVLFDPLADSDTCSRDIEKFKDLGINTIRVYSIDNTADHDDCMKQLADAGIYVLLDVNIPNASISRDSAECSYNTMYLNEVLATVKNMAQYNNTLGFFAGNEVINDGPSIAAAPYVKAVVRDMKNFIKNTGLRSIPVGYSAADTTQGLDTAEYLNCGSDSMARVDMFGFNDYSWCGSSATFTTSGYSTKVEEYGNYSVPLFFSEYGCNTVSPRPFTEVGTIYSDKMSPVFSGGLVYEYSQEVSNYGLVEIESNSSVSTLEDFDNLKSQFAKTSNPSGDGDYHASEAASNCPAESSTWNATTTLPDTPGGALKYINGNTEPSGSGFDASTQWACVDGNNNNTDGSDSSSKTTSTGSSSTSTSSSTATASSSTKKSDGAIMEVSTYGFLGIVVAIMSLL
ncbi:1,3-beta-glucanosyltransferase Pga4p [[Candida] railenensis]|uniref:1,3-beta-glucanosyltransferase n=1 Tax=[Candida] railenensis TaxID=45579 RepID=A0A9P0QN83_9ASCO|nr:1,3-beta-glucanosyltransferase Pga4p [[Candida] railenensis]